MRAEHGVPEDASQCDIDHRFGVSEERSPNPHDVGGAEWRCGKMGQVLC